MKRVRRSCGYVNGIEVGSDGTKGGLCLAWRNDVSITLRNCSKRHINVIIEHDKVMNKWRFIGFYGTPYA